MILATSACAVLVLGLPGLAAAAWIRPARDWPLLGALSVGISIAIWPLLALWWSLLGIRWGPAHTWVLLTLCAVVAVAGLVRQGWPALGGWHTAALLGILAAAFALRDAQAAELVAPAWVDGLHHTEITQLILSEGGLPRTLRPFMPVDRFFYHFGFHVVAAATAWARGSSATEAVLVVGQVLSALACLATYALARAARINREACLAAAAVPATMYWFPMYFVTWSRFTQLAGLVALPAAWIILWRALERPRGGMIALAAVCAAGLVLVHYRVAVFYGAGVAAALVLGALSRRGRDLARFVGSLAAVTAIAVALAAPWLISNVRAGVHDLESATERVRSEPSIAPSAAPAETWYEAAEGTLTVPAWLFKQRYNGLILAAGAAGLAIGLLRRRAAAAWLALTCALVALAARPQALGLPETWLVPGFAAAISLFLPVGVGVAYLVDALVRAVHRRYPRPVVARVVRAGVLAVAIAGAFELTPAGLRPVVVLNAGTVIVTDADLDAARWIAANTAPEDRFLISTGGWHLGTFRGLDGGYWLPLTAGRETTMPGALYSFGDYDTVSSITKLGRRLEKGDALTDGELAALMAEEGARFVYVGPAGAELGGKLSAQRLAQVPYLHEVYAANGVNVFERR